MRKFEEIERLIGDARHSEALALLEALPLSGLTQKELAYYHVLLVETRAIVGPCVSAEEIDKAIETFRYDSDTVLFARAKYAKGLWCLCECDYSNAQETLLEAYTGFLRCRQLFHAARALNRLSYLSLQQGDVHTATDYLEKATQIHRQLGDRKSEMRFCVNLSIMYNLTGRLTDSELICRRLEKHLDVFNNHTKTIFLLTCGITHSLRGNTREALKTLDRVKPYLEEYPRQEFFYYQYRGWAHVNAEDYHAAIDILSTGLRVAEKKKIVMEGTTIKRLLADSYVATGRYEEAERYAKEVLAHAQTTNERAEIACCYRIFAQVEQRRKNTEGARRWFDQALDILDLIFCRYQLAATRCLAAGCAAYSDDEKAYMLSRAHEYFTLENVTHKIARVEEQLKTFRKSSRGRDSTGRRRHRAGSGMHNESPTVIANDSRMKELLAIADKVAASDITVFLTGPTGSGKDVLARHIHHLSGRGGPFISVNAAAVPDTMVESELFGHARGAFTGADHDKPGLFEMADNGTFYLNEIADATASFQAKLLEVIETRKVRRLGKNEYQPVDFRLIAATNHDLEQRMSEGLFRRDLFHRLNEISLQLPALKDRTDDIRPLVEHFLRTSGFDPRHDGNPEQLAMLAEVLARDDWPGNVRQLRAEVNRLLLTSNRNLREMIRLAKGSGAGGEADSYQALLDALETAGGNKSKAARALGIKESTLRYRLKKYRAASGPETSK